MPNPKITRDPRLHGGLVVTLELVFEIGHDNAVSSHSR